MNQLSFDSAPVLDDHLDFTAPGPDLRIEDVEVARRLHRRDFRPMDANNRKAGRVVSYSIKPAVLPDVVPMVPQGPVDAAETRRKVALGLVSAESMRIRLREQKAVNALVLSGGDVLNPL